MPYDKDQERIFKELVKIPLDSAFNVEIGMNFIKFNDSKTGKTYQIAIKEIKK